MSAKKPNISQIDKYLNGELDARAMHQLERKAQDDPFLMDALEGYENAGKDQQANLADLKEQLAKRTAPAKQRSLILWRVLPVAATILLMLGAGYWFLKPAPDKKQYANVSVENKKQDFINPPIKETVIKPVDAIAKNYTPASAENPPPQKEGIVEQNPIANNINAPRDSRAVYSQHEGVWSIPPTYKKDTIEYLAKDYRVRPNAPVEDVLKKMESIEVSHDGSISFQGQLVTKAKLNGKDFSGGDLSAAVKNLPADIIDKIQIVNDYGDQSAKTSIKTGQPAKMLNLTTDSLNKTTLIAANKPSPQLREISIAGAVSESRVTRRTADREQQDADRTVSGKVLDQQGAPLIGATVILDGTGKAVATDVNGNFKIDLPANKDLLAVNYIGYNTKQVKVGSDTHLNIALQTNDNSLNEVVVAGYGMSKKTKATSTPCKENLKFKPRFFGQITIVEKYTNEHINATKQTIQPPAFKKAVTFLTKYTKVPADGMNDAGYKNLQAFNADKEKWLKWYETNKCNNLK